MATPEEYISSILISLKSIQEKLDAGHKMSPSSAESLKEIDSTLDDIYEEIASPFES